MITANTSFRRPGSDPGRSRGCPPTWRRSLQPHPELTFLQFTTTTLPTHLTHSLHNKTHPTTHPSPLLAMGMVTGKRCNPPPGGLQHSCRRLGTEMVGLVNCRVSPYPKTTQLASPRHLGAGRVKHSFAVLVLQKPSRSNWVSGHEFQCFHFLSWYYLCLRIEFVFVTRANTRKGAKEQVRGFLQRSILSCGYLLTLWEMENHPKQFFLVSTWQCFQQDYHCPCWLERKRRSEAPI